MSLGRAAACLPGEFEPQAAILLGCNELLPVYPQVLVDVVDALIDRMPLIGVVDSEEQRRQVVTLLCDWGLPSHLMHFVFLPVKGMWLRDYGPSFVRSDEGSLTIIDAKYLQDERRTDVQALGELAELLKLPIARVPLSIEGGNLLSNGQGLALATEAIITRNGHRGHDRAQVEALLRAHYGLDQLIVLQPLACEPTAHVDIFATFVEPDVVLVGQYDRAVDAVNADVLDQNAQRLAEVRTSSGPLKVLRIPMPINRGGIWRTYTSVIYADGTLLMPTYAGVDAETEKAAVDVYAGLLRDWEIIGVESSALGLNRGALRAISINVPWLKDGLARPQRREVGRSHTADLLHPKRACG